MPFAGPSVSNSFYRPALPTHAGALAKKTSATHKKHTYSTRSKRHITLICQQYKNSLAALHSVKLCSKHESSLSRSSSSNVRRCLKHGSCTPHRRCHGGILSQPRFSS